MASWTCLAGPDWVLNSTPPPSAVLQKAPPTTRKHARVFPPHNFREIARVAVPMGFSGSLRGITWNHTRGYAPMVAAGQRFEDLNRGVEILWQKRSLKDFGEAPLDELAERFDLLVIDHPYVGYVADRQILEPLERHLPAESLNALAGSSVGRSYESYWFDAHSWALPIDAAAPVSSWRPDLMEQAGIGVPRTWDKVLELAGRG